jgi:hypothetical protein
MPLAEPGNLTRASATWADLLVCETRLLTIVLWQNSPSLTEGAPGSGSAVECAAIVSTRKLGEFLAHGGAQRIYPVALLDCPLACHNRCHGVGPSTDRMRFANLSRLGVRSWQTFACLRYLLRGGRPVDER